MTPDTSTPATYRASVLQALLAFRDRGYDPTLQQIGAFIGHPLAAATVGAKLRELRNPDYGPPRERGEKPRGYEITCYRSAHEEARLPLGTKIYRYKLVR